MLVQSGLLQEYLKTTNAITHLSGTICSWKPETIQLKIGRKPLIQSIVICSVVALCQIFDLLQLYFGNKDNWNHFVKTKNAGLDAYMNEMHSEDLERFFNEAVKLDYSRSKDLGDIPLDEKFKIKIAKLTCLVMRNSGLIMTPILITICGTVEPLLPMNVLYNPPLKQLVLKIVTLKCKCESNVFQTDCIVWIFVRILIFVLNYIAWVHMLKSLMTMAIQFVVGSMALSFSISTFQRKLLQKTLRTYRKIQILTQIFNGIHSSALVTYLGCAVLTQIIPATQLINGPNVAYHANHVIFWTRLFLFVALINGFASMALYFFVADVYHKSCICLGKIRNSANLLLKSRTNRRLVRALPVLKIDFGSANYIEKITPVVFQHFTVLRIIDILLVSKQSFT